VALNPHYLSDPKTSNYYLRYTILPH
jgi:hypothetical protein